MNEDEAYALVERIKQFLEDYSDVHPEKAKMLIQGCDELLTWLEKF